MKSFFTSTVLIFLFITTRISHAQNPGADIYLADYKMKEGKLAFDLIHNLTNRAGYDNQPFFLPSGEGLLFTVIAADGQADIYQCLIAKRAITQVTRTPESEYSPTLMPDGKHFSVVRVEKDSSQRLWKFPLAGGAPSLVLEKVKPVGYHAWVDANTLALFVLGTPNTLQIADVRTGATKTVGGNISRALHKIPKRNAFSFVHKINEEFWNIKAYNVAASNIEVLIKTLPGSEDCAWTPEGILLSASGAKLYQWNPKDKKEWVELVNLEKLGYKNITRLAVSPKSNRLAFVANDQSAN